MLLSFSELDVLIYQGKVGGLFRERKNERVATDIDSRNKSSSSSHEYDSVLSFNLFVIMERNKCEFNKLEY